MLLSTVYYTTITSAVTFCLNKHGSVPIVHISTLVPLLAIKIAKDLVVRLSSTGMNGPGISGGIEIFRLGSKNSEKWVFLLNVCLAAGRA